MKIIFIRNIVILFFLFLSALSAQGFSISHYNTEMGLPDQRIYDMLQLDDGSMLFVHRQFLSVYNAQEWKIIPVNIDGRKSGYKIKQTKNGNFYLGSNEIIGKTAVYKNNEWLELENDTLSKNSLDKTSSLLLYDFELIDVNGIIELAKCDDKDVFVYRNVWEKLKLPKTKRKPDLISLEYIDNNLYVCSTEGIFIKNPDGITHFKPTEIGAPTDYIVSVFKYVDHNNSEQLWILSNTWIGYFENDKFNLISEFQPLPMFDIGVNHFFLKVFNSDVFFGNQSLVCYVDKKSNKVTTLTMTEGLITDGATQVLEDREKNIWLTTYRGINKLRRRAFEIYTSHEGLLSDEVTAIEELNDGTMVLGFNSGVGFLKDKKISNYEFSNVSEYSGAFRRVFDLLVDKEDIWLAATNVGVGKLYSNGNIKWYNVPEKRFYYTLYKDDKNFIVGTYNGLMYFKNGKLIDDDLTKNNKYYVKKIYRYNENSLLLATNHGIVKYDGKTSESIRYDKIKSIYAFLEIGKEKFYVGTTEGLFVLENEDVFKADLNGRFIDDDIYFINRDKSGNIWIGTDNGVYIFDNQDLYHITTAQGLPHNETNRDAGFLDSKGSFWVGTARGLVKFNRLPEKIDSVKPFLNINKFEDFEGKLHNFQNEIVRDYYDNSFTILFNGISFIDESKLEYEISIIDHKDDKINHFYQKENKFRVSNLASGEYNFNIRVKNPLGVWSDYTKIKIYIDSPFFKKAWFILVILIVIVFIVLFIQNFVHQKNYSQKLLYEVDERTRSLHISNKKYRIISESIDEVIWSFDNNLQLDYISPAVQNLMGYSAESIYRLDLNKPIVERLCEKFEEFNLDKIKKETIVTEYKYKAGPHKNRFFEIYTSPIINNNQFQGVIGVTREISQRVAKERVKSAAIVQTIEKERSRIARDLHDHLGQILASIKLRLEMFQLKNEEDPNIDEAYNQLTVVKTELKNIIEDLNPLPYGKLDLVEALEDLCTSYNRKRKIAIDLSFKSNVDYIDFDEEKRLLLFRIVQESLTNAITHSQAKKIEIEINSTSKQFVLSVKDNGCGFDQVQLKKTKGFGFQNMRQRAAILGAEFHVESFLDEGTIISIKM